MTGQNKFTSFCVIQSLAPRSYQVFAFSLVHRDVKDEVRVCTLHLRSRAREGRPRARKDQRRHAGRRRPAAQEALAQDREVCCAG